MELLDDGWINSRYRATLIFNGSALKAVDA